MPKRCKDRRRRSTSLPRNLDQEELQGLELQQATLDCRDGASANIAEQTIAGVSPLESPSYATLPVSGWKSRRHHNHPHRHLRRRSSRHRQSPDITGAAAPSNSGVRLESTYSGQSPAKFKGQRAEAAQCHGQELATSLEQQEHCCFVQVAAPASAPACVVDAAPPASGPPAQGSDVGSEEGEQQQQRQPPERPTEV